jgi:uncharacterized protein YjiS (DUF1127 family)
VKLEDAISPFALAEVLMSVSQCATRSLRRFALGSSLFRSWRAVFERRRQANELACLMQMSDAELRDMGITRFDVVSEMRNRRRLFRGKS